MNERKLFLLSLSTTIVLIFSIGVFSFLITNITFTSKKIYSNQSARRYNSVIINNQDFDSIIIGSSMSQGSKCSDFDLVFGGNSVKLACSAINFSEIDFFIDYAAKKKKIKRVMFDAPVTFFCREQTTREIPKEYYQDSVKFTLFKKGFSINSVIDSFAEAKNLISKKSKHITRDELYDWNLKRKCSEKAFADKLLYDKGLPFDINSDFAEKSKVCVKNIVIPIFNSHPDTEFVIFYPPFSMMYYRSLDRKAYIKLKGEVTDMLLQVKNVKLFDFETAFHITGNFENYRDTRHYSGKINSWMIEQMAQENYRVTQSNKQQYLDKLLKRFEEYDFDKEYSRIEAKYGKKRK